MVEEFSDGEFSFDVSVAREKVQGCLFIKRLGKGSLAIVDLVSIDGKHYVLKSMEMKPSDHEEERAARIRNEVKIIKSLMQARASDKTLPRFHPCYRAALMMDGEGGRQRVVIVMEHQQEVSTTLHHIIHSASLPGSNERGGIDEDKTRGIIKQVVIALGRIHKIGLCLVDLKAENVLVGSSSSSSPEVRLIDFDLSRPLDSPALGEEEKIFGTLDYLPPELVQRTGTYSFSLDWWALGILTYECLLGYTPFAADTIERVFYNISNRAPQFPQGHELSFKCTAFIRSLLRHKVEHRLGSAGGVGEVLAHPWLAD